MKTILTILILFISILSVQGQTSSDKLIRQGVALHDKGDYREAISNYEEALRINPTSMSAIYEMSLSYLHLKDYNNAMKYSSKIIDANFQPLLVDAYTVKSTALANQNKVSDAITLLNQALDRCGDEYLLHFNLGLSYFNQKNTKMAILHLRKAIEIDATHSSAFLLYAYALNDADRWIQSFYSFHFFLLLEPNTQRSKDAFAELYDMLATKSSTESRIVQPEDGVNRQKLFQAIKQKQPATQDAASQYNFFQEASKLIFFTLGQMQNDTQSGLLWNFFTPTYSEILDSGFFDAYCRYVSVAYFPESLEWWNNNKTEVDNFIEWFEHGQRESEEDAYFGDDSEGSDNSSEQ